MKQIFWYEKNFIKNEAEKIKSIPNGEEVEMVVNQELFEVFSNKEVEKLLKCLNLKKVNILLKTDGKKEFDSFCSLFALPSIEELDLGFVYEKKSSKIQNFLQKFEKLKTLTMTFEKGKTKVLPNNLKFLEKLELFDFGIDKEIEEKFANTKLKEIVFRYCTFNYHELNLNYSQIHSLIFYSCNGIDMKSLYEWLKEKKELKLFHLAKSTVNNMEYFKDLLKITKIQNLVYEMNDYIFDEDSTFNIESLKIKYTKKVQIKYKNDHFLDGPLLLLLCCKDLKSLEFENETNSFQIQNFFGILKRYKDLRYLKIKIIQTYFKIETLSQYINQNKLLNELIIIHDCKLDSCDSLIKSLKTSNIKNLELSYWSHSMNDIIFEDTLESLTINYPIQNLDLLKSTLKTMIKNQKIKTLKLKIKGDFSNIIQKYLSSNSFLENFEINIIDSYKNFQIILKGLYFNHTLKSFTADVIDNDINYESEIRELFYFNTTLTKFEIFQNHHKHQIEYFIKRNRKTCAIYHISLKLSDLSFRF